MKTIGFIVIALAATSGCGAGDGEEDELLTVSEAEQDESGLSAFKVISGLKSKTWWGPDSVYWANFFTYRYDDGASGTKLVLENHTKNPMPAHVTIRSNCGSHTFDWTIPPEGGPFMDLSVSCKNGKTVSYATVSFSVTPKK